MFVSFLMCALTGTKQSVLQDPGTAAPQPVLLWLSLPSRAAEGVWTYTGSCSIQFL